MSRVNNLETFWLSVRYASRALRRDLLFSVPVILCIALVVGANSMVFSIVDALVLRAVPFEDPDRLVALNSLHASPGMAPQPSEVSPKDFTAWREQVRSFSGLASVYPRNFNLAVASEGGAGESDLLEPERVEGARVSASFFPLLRVQPVQGRAFAAEEEQPGREPVAILSDRLWRRRFAADPRIVGKTFLVDGKSTRVVGVMPPGFRYPADSEMWTPQTFEPASPTNEWHYIAPIARLAPGVSPERAESELVNVARRLEGEFPQTNTGWSAALAPLADRLIGDLKPRLLALSAGVGFLLLIACANIANLLLVRATARGKEMAVRAAMGSSKRQLAALVLAEGVLLALAGGAIGLLLTWLVNVLIARAPLNIPALRDVALNLRVLGFTLLIAFASGLLFSLAPALRFLRLDPQPYLKEGTRGSSQGAGQRLQGLFVVLQVAVSVVLLTSAALLLRSFSALQGVDPGFDPKGLLTMRVSLPEAKYPSNPERVLFADEAVRRLGSLPGVRSAALTTALPIGDRDVDFSASFSIEGRIPTDAGSKYLATIRRVSPSYFDTMGIRLIAGRGFNAADRPDSPGVVVVSHRMADQYWPGESPVGKRLKLGDYDSTNPWLTVVGVVGDIKDEGLQGELEPIWYRPYAQHEDKSARYVALLLRAQAAPAALIRPARQEIRAMDNLLPVYKIATMDELLDESLAQQRVITAVFGALAFLGLLIAAIGLYGVMSYVVDQRRQEIGIRMAIGARRGDVLGLVMRRGMLLTCLGLALGLGGVLLLSRPLSSLLYGVRATDPLSYAAILLLLGGVAMLANLVPARRATRVDPMIAFREG
jgi:putative ABC transport system permease protein